MNSNSLFQDSVDDSRLKQLFAWVTSIYDSPPAGFSSVWVPFFFFFLYSLLELLQLKLKTKQLLAMQALARWRSRSKSFTYNEIKACKCDHKHQNHCTVHYEIDLEKKIEKWRFFDVRQLKRAEQGDEPIKLQWKGHFILLAQFDIIYMLIVAVFRKQQQDIHVWENRL